MTEEEIQKVNNEEEIIETQEETKPSNEYGFEYVKEEKKVLVDENANEIKALDDDKRVIGTDRVRKLIHENKLSKVFVTNNAPEDIKMEIINIAKMANVPVVELAFDNKELGLNCKKVFSISILGVMK